MSLAANHPALRSTGVSPMPPVEARAGRPCYGARPRRGFTLIEVLATLVLLGIVMPVAMRGVSLALSAASTARRTAEAASLADMKLNELIADGSWQTGGTSGDFADHNEPDYRWTCESSSRDYGTYEVVLHVTWTQRGQERSFSLCTLVYPDAYAGSSSAGGSTATGGVQ